MQKYLVVFILLFTTTCAWAEDSIDALRAANARLHEKFLQESYYAPDSINQVADCLAHFIGEITTPSGSPSEIITLSEFRLTAQIFSSFFDLYLMTDHGEVILPQVDPNDLHTPQFIREALAERLLPMVDAFIDEDFNTADFLWTVFVTWLKFVADIHDEHPDAIDHPEKVLNTADVLLLAVMAFLPGEFSDDSESSEDSLLSDDDEDFAALEAGGSAHENTLSFNFPASPFS